MLRSPAAAPDPGMELSIYLKHFPVDGPRNDGTSLAVAGLATGLARCGAHVSVLCEGPQCRSVETPEGFRIECFDNRGSRSRFSLAAGMEDHVASHLRRARALCLLNGMFHPGVYAMSRCLRRHGVPYVAVPHDPYNGAVFRKNAHLKWPYWLLFEYRLLAHAGAVQVFDPAHTECLRRLGVGTRVIETENGVAPERVPGEATLHWRTRGAPPRLAFLGRIDSYNKGLDILLDAFARLDCARDAALTLHGPDWGDRAALEARARRNGIAARVAFPGADYTRSSPEIIAQHDVFCLPSRFEGFGLAALEAMLAARVLLVSSCAGIARHVEASGCGIVVNPDVQGVLAGLRTLLDRRADWREMGLRGRSYALGRLRWDAIAAGLLPQYGELIS